MNAPTSKQRQQRQLPASREKRDAFTVQEAADRLGVGRATIYKWWSEGQGPPAIKVGRRRLISREALENWLRDQTATSSDSQGE